MSKLDELIAELCPDGVEYASIGSLIKRIRERGKDDISVQQVYVVSNSLGIVRAEDYRDNTIHSEDTSNYTIIRKNMFAYNPSRLNIGSIAMLKEEEPGLVSPMYVVFSIDETQIVKEYFEYVLKSPYVMNKINSYKEEGARFRFNFDRWDWIRIPLPPLPVQQEIVRILDNFTELTAELTTELTARRKQYEYYRDLLLTFGDEVPRVAIDDLFNIRNGYTPSKSNKEYWENGVIPWFRMEDIRENGRILSNALQYVSINAVKGRPFPANSIIISTSATIGEHALIQTEFLANQRFTILSLKNEYQDVNIKYLFYYCYIFGEWCKNNLTLGHFASVDMVAFKKFRIPLPPLKEQERIVAILDRFDALCNDLTSGIPAEIEARQKQYEYYRDKLLSFKEVTA